MPEFTINIEDGKLMKWIRKKVNQELNKVLSDKKEITDILYHCVDEQIKSHMSHIKDTIDETIKTYVKNVMTQNSLFDDYITGVVREVLLDKLKKAWE